MTAVNSTRNVIEPGPQMSFADPDVKMLAPPTEVRDLAREKTAKQLEAAAVWVK